MGEFLQQNLLNILKEIHSTFPPDAKRIDEMLRIIPISNEISRDYLITGRYLYHLLESLTSPSYRPQPPFHTSAHTTMHMALTLPLIAAILSIIAAGTFSTVATSTTPSQLNRHIIRFTSPQARALYMDRLNSDFPAHAATNPAITVHLLDDIFIGAIISHNNDVVFAEEDRRLQHLHLLSLDSSSDVNLIEHFERDAMIFTTAPPSQSTTVPQFSATQTQTDAPWHLDRLCKDSLPLSGTFDYTQHGSPVNIYIVDTGIRTSHSEFQGRARAAFSSQRNLSPGEDCHGHGTHTAALVAGKVSGINKNAIVHDVRVMDCFGSGANSDVVKGLDWIAKNAKKPAVVNMSFGGRVSEVVDTAVKSLSAKGILPVVAAGNEGLDACQRSPARVQESLTVGASTKQDFRAPFSNNGPCVDVYAPGVDIVSASHLGDNDVAVLSGTSMAAPMVSGIASVLLSQYIDITPAQLKEKLIEHSLQNVHEEIRPFARLPDEAICPKGFGGSDCSTPVCGNQLATNHNVCGGNGRCTGPQTCECNAQYHGPYCEEFTCAAVSHRNSSLVCNGGHGKCTAPDTCECNNGWSGENCEVAPPVTCFEKSQNDAAVCSGHGSCEGTDRCKCAPGYSGEDCSAFSCFEKSASSTRTCSGRGSCVAPNQCECSQGFFGFECETSSQGAEGNVAAIITANIPNAAVVNPNVDLVLSGNSSYDPQAGADTSIELHYEWTCRELSADSRLSNRCVEIHGRSGETLTLGSTLLHNMKGGHFAISLLVTSTMKEARDEGFATTSTAHRREYTSLMMSVADCEQLECKGYCLR